MSYSIQSITQRSQKVLRPKKPKLKIQMGQEDALIVVDLQNDFLPWGSLPVKNSDRLIVHIYNLIKAAHRSGAFVVASKDWHPENHSSFGAHGGIWPAHCVRDTFGANYPRGFPKQFLSLEVLKGTESHIESYSAFRSDCYVSAGAKYRFSPQEKFTDLADLLRAQGCRRIYVCGLTTEYCVAETAKDSIEAGFETVFLHPLTYPVNPLNATPVLNRLKGNGVVIYEQ